MTLPGWTPLALATALYMWQAGEYFTRGQMPLGFVFIGYSVANLGLIFDFIKRVEPISRQL